MCRAVLFGSSSIASDAARLADWGGPHGAIIAELLMEEADLCFKRFDERFCLISYFVGVLKPR